MMHPCSACGGDCYGGNRCPAYAKSETAQYVYNIGYHSHEESSYRQYQHSRSFSDSELRAVVAACLWEGFQAVHRPDGEHDRERTPSFALCMDTDAFSHALAERGFRPVEFAASFSVFGWAEAHIPGSWESHHSARDLQELLSRRLGATKAGHE